MLFVTSLLVRCCRPDVLQAGESDLSTVGQLMRFVFLSNFTGHPAISLPAGHNSQGSVYVFSSQPIRYWQLPSCAKLCTHLSLFPLVKIASMFSAHPPPDAGSFLLVQSCASPQMSQMLL